MNRQLIANFLLLSIEKKKEKLTHIINKFKRDDVFFWYLAIKIQKANEKVIENVYKQILEFGEFIKDKENEIKSRTTKKTLKKIQEKEQKSNQQEDIDQILTKWFD